MTTPLPIPMQQDLMHVTQAEIARTSRHAAQVREVRLSAGHHRRRPIRAVLAALFPARRVRPSLRVAENRGDT
jgi:hypothetical protein